MACPTTLPKWDGYCRAAVGADKSRRCVPPNGTRTQSKTGGTGASPNSKNALAEGRTILWADESGSYLLPALLRTWAPVAQTPVIQRKLSYDHLSAISAISAISLTRDLYLAVQDHSYKGADVIGFLEQLLAEIPGKLPVIWDDAPIHRRRAVKDYLALGAARRLRLEQLPWYAPELNPDEGVWRYLKRVELKNVVCADLGHLRREFWAAVQRLLAKPDVLRACVREVGYV